MGTYYTIDQIAPPAPPAPSAPPADAGFEAALDRAAAGAVRHGLNRRGNVVESCVLRGRTRDGATTYLWLNRWQGVGASPRALASLVQQLREAGAEVTPLKAESAGEWEELATHRRE